MPDLQKICLRETVGGKTITIQTGTVAKQAGGAVTVHLEDSCILTTTTAAREPKLNLNFTPLTVEYRERTYAAGKIPGGFFKREGRPREKEILSARLTDRPIRPLFQEGWNYETMVHTLVLSVDGKNDTDVLAVLGGSTSLLLSEVPWSGPVAAVRIGRLNGQLVFFPTFEERETLELELVVAGKKDAILMVEGGGNEVGEDVMVEALEAAQREINKLCALQLKLVAEAQQGGRKIVKRSIQPPAQPEAAKQFVADKATPEIKKILRRALPKWDLDEAMRALKDGLKAGIVERGKADPSFAGAESWVSHWTEDILYRESREMCLSDKVRQDGRKWNEIRTITVQAPALPRLHGSALFTRGSTQALVAVTLGTPGDMQIMDELEGEYKERFLLHYNFPGFSVGEVRPERGPGRREIGHGALAKRALYPLLPNEEEFAYTIRIVSDILESNGSSSMASVCGGSLALFDAGVPMKGACAGIAMGLILEGSRHAILSDINGFEDHLGDMDFKVAGTRNGITGFQLDMKIEGLSVDILKAALAQAREGRLHILDRMDAAIANPRPELSPQAPRLLRLMIPIDKIGALIGPGGKNIRRIIEEYGVEVDVEDDGSVFIAGTDAAGVDRAKAEVEALSVIPEVGTTYKGRVVSIKEFGAFVEILPGHEGLLHISQLDIKRVNRVEDVLRMGDEVEVKLIEIDPSGKMRLSRKAITHPGSEIDSRGSGPGGGKPRDGERGGHGFRHRERGPRPR
ncbi:MAG: polyribonucleotide nucleotidyltransferase [Elusimicrobia bacterium]|nr:polyribonucleotide nucleotidyltransferase [Elusimicrobiota bacterium]